MFPKKLNCLISDATNFNFVESQVIPKPLPFKLSNPDINVSERFIKERVSKEKLLLLLLYTSKAFSGVSTGSTRLDVSVLSVILSARSIFEICSSI